MNISEMGRPFNTSYKNPKCVQGVGRGEERENALLAGRLIEYKVSLKNIERTQEAGKLKNQLFQKS